MNIKISLDDDTFELISWLAAATGLPISDLIDRLLSSHLSDLWELRTFLEVPTTDIHQREQSLNLLQSYGHEETILDGIKRIAPGYTTLEAQFAQSIDASMKPKTQSMQ